MSTIEAIVRSNLCATLGRPVEEGPQLNMDQTLAYEYGLGSLDLIMLMSAVCTEAGIPLTELSEDDIARVRTPGNIIGLLAAKVSA